MGGPFPQISTDHVDSPSGSPKLAANEPLGRGRWLLSRASASPGGVGFRNLRGVETERPHTMREVFGVVWVVPVHFGGSNPPQKKSRPFWGPRLKDEPQKPPRLDLFASLKTGDSSVVLTSKLDNFLEWCPSPKVRSEGNIAMTHIWRFDR